MIFRPVRLLLGRGRKGQGFLLQTASSSMGVGEGFIGADQKILAWLVNVIFLERVKTACRLGIKSRFGIMGFGTSDAILGLWFFSLTVFFLKLINLFLAALCLCCCASAFSSCGERGLLFIAVRRLLIVVASLVVEHRL